VPGERILGAVERLQHLKGQLGEVASTLLELLIIQEQCWAKIGEHFGVSAKTAKSWCLAAVKRLGEVF
jgi:hypothetical protein